MMGKEYRIGVIAPQLDGEYYGRMIPIIHQYVRSKNGQLFAVQSAGDTLGITALQEPVAFHIVDAWISMLPADNVSFATFLEQSGKPVVSVGFSSGASEARSVVIPNRESMKQAVLHLIDVHGLREIAYIGSRRQHDLEERYEGYRSALAERGLAIEETLIAMTDDNFAEGGALAAERLLDGGASFAAIVAATDWNALGAIDALQRRGYAVPQDIAVIGFGDIDQAAVSAPALTTVRQPLEALAGEAVRKIFALLEGADIADGPTYVPAPFVPRLSCGCAAEGERADPPADSFMQLSSSLHQITANNFKMTQGLILAAKEEKIHISKLFWNLSHWGCLALWENDGSGGRRLVVRQTFSKRGDPLPPEGEAFRLEDFPPSRYYPPEARPGGRDMVIIHPVKSELQDWGYLALASPVDPMSGIVANDLSRHSFTILAVALERELLFDQIRSIAEKLEIVSRTTNDGIWDWDLENDRIDWNSRARKMLSGAAVPVTEDRETFLELVHPEDRPAVDDAFRQPFGGDEPIQLEFRIRGLDEGVVWVYLAGDVVRDADGRARRVIGSLTDITEKKANEARIIQLAYHDTLTGLPNRLLFQERLRKAMEDREQHGGQLAVFMIDLDRFKIVNDTLGHQVGDNLLRQVSDTLRECIGDGDTIARLGGDEFIVLLPFIEGEEEAALVADRMLRKLSEPFFLEEMEFFLSASIGVSLYPAHGVDSETLIKFADMAMYQTKKHGGNRMRIYTPDLSSKQVERFYLENGLRRAMERDEFVLHFQPQISLSTGKVYGAEALLRWDAPGGSQIQPGDFIPLAEEIGLIIPVGQWVLERACMECKRWLNAGMPSLVISVNISVQQFQQDHFPDLVRKVLKRTGIQPYNLCLEITEYIAVQNMDHTIRVLSELVEIGVKIAMDDFGIGQSPLILLKRLPVHMVKIDPSFILNMMADPDDEAIAKGIIDMAHSLGLSVTAEGVETEDQLERLQQMECDRIQGFYTGRPMTSDQFIGYFKELSV